MHKRKYRVEKGFTISVGELIFNVRNNKLTVIHPEVGHIQTPIAKEELVTLSEFATKATDIVDPVPGSKLVYQNEEGPQKIYLFIDERGHYLLLINNQVQFTTDSEIVYHEALVGPAVCSLESPPKKFLILGGGDGLASKQIIKENPQAEIVLVDFDKNITDLFTYDENLAVFNEFSMSKCKVINEDAFVFVQNHKEKYDVIICDFPDPDEEIFNKLYSIEFYLNTKELLNPNGVISVQSGSLANESKCFKCIRKTIEASGFKTITFNTPSSFGNLVYTLGKLESTPEPVITRSSRKYKTITQEYFDKAMKVFRPDSYSDGEVEINTVENFIALEYRLEETKEDK
jgi:spermidine synthase